MNFHIVTLFPESFDSYINSSIIGRAVRAKKIKIKFYNPRDFVPASSNSRPKDKPYLRVDGKPYGGGPGMVMQALPVIKAVEKALKNSLLKNKKYKLTDRHTKVSIPVVWLTPSGKQFSNQTADKLKKREHAIIICGRYEGIDERVLKVIKKIKELKIEKLTVGPYVLTGGELPAMIILDATARRIPGVLGKIESVEENRMASSEVYTRPEALDYRGKKYRVPSVLLSGHHAKIKEWKSRSK